MKKGFFPSSNIQRSPKNFISFLHIHQISISPRSKAALSPTRSPLHTQHPTSPLPTEPRRRQATVSAADSPHWRKLAGNPQESREMGGVSQDKYRRIAMRMKLVPLNRRENDYQSGSIDQRKLDGLQIRYFRRRPEREGRSEHHSVLLSANIPIPASSLGLETVLSPAFRFDPCHFQ